MENKPCYMCVDRRVTSDYNCHSHCERYLGNKEKNDAKTEIIRKKKAEEREVTDVRIRSIIKVTKDPTVNKQGAWKRK